VTEQDLNDLPREHASNHRVPGAAIGVLRDGVETFAWYGNANTRTGAPVTATSCFGVGSLTKSMVATGVARLAEDGRLSLDDPVVARVPEVRGAAGRPRIIYVMLWGLPRLDE
jgi:beta-lactamase class C